MYVYDTKVPDGKSADITFIPAPEQYRPVMIAIVKDEDGNPIATCPVNWSVNSKPKDE